MVLQKNKVGKQVILYTTNPVQQDAYIQQAVAKGYKVVKMETMVDAAVVTPQPTPEECQRYFDANQAQFVVGQALHLRQHCTSVVATDVSRRCLAVAAFNAAMNDVAMTTSRLDRVFTTTCSSGVGLHRVERDFDHAAGAVELAGFCRVDPHELAALHLHTDQALAPDFATDVRG